MVDSHFDTKSFLKAVIENSDSEEEIHKAMQQITSRNKKGSKKKAPKMTALLDGELDE